jgi:hypothetical protein
MPNKRHKPEEIVAKLRGEVLNLLEILEGCCPAGR